MLIRFRFENFRSFRELQELSLVAQKRSEPSDSLIQVADLGEDLLPSAVIYGANASGKSNVLLALRFFSVAIRDSHNAWKPDSPINRDAFALESSEDVPTLFDTAFVIDGVRYEYGFKLDSKTIVGEWLYAYPNGRRQMWFTRSSNDDERMRFGKHFYGENRTIDTLTRKNSLFLSAAAQNNHELITPIFRGLTEGVSFDFGFRKNVGAEYSKQLKNPKLIEQISRMMGLADVGVVGVDVQTLDVDQAITDALAQMMSKLSSTLSLPIPYKPAKEILEVKLKHRNKRGEAVSMASQFESAGTITFLSLLCPVFEALNSGRTLCVDELSSSLHPLLALEIVKLFSRRDTNPKGAQLIFNTHDVTLLDGDIFRRDQIWFTEKNVDGASQLYPLSDFHPRINENLRRGYLQGRFGAIPFLGTSALVRQQE
jgi:uncharacterized protein